VTTETHVIHLSVRDYECDMQGVVNNAVYQNYLEHARHEFLKAHGIDFATVTRSGINLLVVRAELDYKGSLTSGDKFIVHTHMEQISRLRFAFHQRIVREVDGKEMVEARIIGSGINQQGRPTLPPDLLQMMTTRSNL